MMSYCASQRMCCVSLGTAQLSAAHPLSPASAQHNIHTARICDCRLPRLICMRGRRSSPRISRWS